MNPDPEPTGYAPLPLSRLPHDVAGEKLYGATAQRTFKLVRLVVSPRSTAPWRGPAWWGRKPPRRRLMMMWRQWQHQAQLRAVAGCGIDRMMTSRYVEGDEWESLLAIDGGAPLDVAVFFADSFAAAVCSPPARRLRLVVVGETTPLDVLALVEIGPK